MTVKLKACPDQDELAEFLLGKLPEEQLESYEYHLSECSPCTETIRSLNVNDTFSDLAKRAFEPIEDLEIETAADQTAIANLVGRMKELGAEALLDSRAEFCIADKATIQARAAEIHRLLEPCDSDEAIGRLAHYQVERLLGAGSTGVVYLATDENLNRSVALKILRPSLGRSARERFIAEARATAAIDAPNVVSIYHVGTKDELAYIAMQWTPGETLEQRLKRDGSLTVQQVRSIGQQIARGLSAAHAKGLIHRDIKPANIWLEHDSDTVKILDFGLVRANDENPQLTCTGMIAGTPCFMSPEQSRGAELNFQSDFFSLGCLLYESLTGQLPFRSTNVLATLQSIQRDSPVPPNEIDTSIPHDISSLTMCLLEKDPANRPPTATAIEDAIVSDPLEWSFKTSCELGKTAKSEKGGGSGLGAQKATGWFRWVGAILACAALAFVALMYPQIIRIATNQGELVIETNDQDIKIEIVDDGGKIRIVDLKTDQAINIVAGKYELRPQSDENSVEIDKQTIVMKRGSKEIVKVSRVEQGLPDIPSRGDLTENLLKSPVDGEANTSLTPVDQQVALKLMERARLSKIFGMGHQKLKMIDQELIAMGYRSEKGYDLDLDKEWAKRLLISMNMKKERLRLKYGAGHPEVREVDAEIKVLNELLGSSGEVLDAYETVRVDDFKKFEKQIGALRIKVQMLNSQFERLRLSISDLRELVWQNDPFLCGLDQHLQVASTKKRWYALSVYDMPNDELAEEIEWLDDFNKRLVKRVKAVRLRLSEISKLKSEYEQLGNHSDRQGADELSKGIGLRLKEFGFRFGKPNKKHSTISLDDIVGRTSEEDEFRRAIASFEIQLWERQAKLDDARLRNDKQQIKSLEKAVWSSETRVQELKNSFEAKKIADRRRELGLENGQQSEASNGREDIPSEHEQLQGNANTPSDSTSSHTPAASFYQLNGICVDSDKSPTSDAEIRLFHVSNGGANRKLVGSTVTEMDGRFVFNELTRFDQTDDKYVMVCRCDGYVSLISSSGIWTQKNPESEVVDFQFDMTKPSPIVGRVVGHDGLPVVGAEVYQLTVAGEPVKGFGYTLTDQNGKFVLDDVRELKVTKLKNGGVIYPQAFYLRSLEHGAYRIQPKKKQGAFELTLRKPIEVTGKIVGLKKSDSVAGIRLAAQQADSLVALNNDLLQPMEWLTTQTDSAGEYRFIVPEGFSFNVFTWGNRGKDGGPSKMFAAAVSMHSQTPDGSSMRLPDMSLVEPVKVTGIVIDQDTGSPVNIGNVGWHGPDRPRTSAAIRFAKIESDGSFKALVVPGINGFYSSSGGSGWHHITTKVRVKRNGNWSEVTTKQYAQGVRNVAVSQAEPIEIELTVKRNEFNHAWE